MRSEAKCFLNTLQQMEPHPTRIKGVPYLVLPTRGSTVP